MEEYKEMMPMFKPLGEEEQKDVLFVVLDSLDWLHGKIEEAKKAKKGAKEYLCQMQAYQFIAEVFIEDPEWMKSVGCSARGFFLSQARKMRKEREEWKKKREA